jgi:uncharacterized membrane protein
MTPFNKECSSSVPINAGLIEMINEYASMVGISAFSLPLTLPFSRLPAPPAATEVDRFEFPANLIASQNGMQPPAFPASSLPQTTTTTTTRSSLHHRHRFTWCDVCSSIIALGIPIYAIALYGATRNLPCEQSLALWALFYGIYGIVSRVLIIVAKFLHVRGRRNAARNLDVFNSLLAILGIGLYIVGAILTFKIPWTNYYCPRALAISARVLFIFLFCLVALSFVGFFCALIRS